jgi:hypothetical protein
MTVPDPALLAQLDRIIELLGVDAVIARAQEANRENLNKGEGPYRKREEHRRGAPPHNDTRHLIEMGRLVNEGATPRAAALVVAPDTRRGPTRESVARRLCRKFLYGDNQQKYRALANEPFIMMVGAPVGSE